MCTVLKVNSRSWESQTKLARGNARTVCLDTPVVISLSTGALLFLGRFVLLPFQRAQIAVQGLPEQNGVTHFEAGDSRAQEVSSLLKTNDPAGFTIVDLLAWGALGHAIGYFVLATASNGYDPTF
jgi:photosystem I subunit V